MHELALVLALSRASARSRCRLPPWNLSVVILGASVIWSGCRHVPQRGGAEFDVPSELALVDQGLVSVPSQQQLAHVLDHAPAVAGVESPEVHATQELIESDSDRGSAAIFSYLTAVRSALQGDDDEAYRGFKEHYEHVQNPHTALHLLQHHPEQHDMAQRLHQAKKMTLVYPQDAPLRVYYASVLMAADRHDEAYTELIVALEIQADHPKALAYLIELELKNHHYEQAQEYARQLAALRGHRLAGTMFELREALKRGHFARAHTLATTILTEYPHHKMVLPLLAYAAIAQGHAAEAATHIAMMHSLAEGAMTQRQAFTQMYGLVHPYPQITEAYEHILAQNLAPAHRQLITVELLWLYYEQNQWTELIRRVYMHADHHPLNPTMKWLLAQATEVSQPEQAATIYASVPRLSTYGPWALESIFAIRRAPYLKPKRGQLAQFMADAKLAAAARELTQLSQPTRNSLSQTGMYYFRRGDFSRALEIFTEGSRRFPHSTFLLLLAQTYYEINEPDRAESIYRRLLATHPLNPMLLNALGYTLTLKQQQLDEAQNLIALAVELAPDQPAYLDSMGWVHFRQGKMEQAYHYLTAALALSPDDAEIHDHLTQLYLARGECAQASHHLLQASQLVSYRSHQSALLKTQQAYQERCSS